MSVDITQIEMDAHCSFGRPKRKQEVLDALIVMNVLINTAYGVGEEEKNRWRVTVRKIESMLETMDIRPARREHIGTLRALAELSNMYLSRRGKY